MVTHSNPWRKKWQPTPIFLPGKSHGHRSLVGYSPLGSQRVRHDGVTQQSWVQTSPLTSGIDKKWCCKAIILPLKISKKKKRRISHVLFTCGPFSVSQLVLKCHQRKPFVLSWNASRYQQQLFETGQKCSQDHVVHDGRSILILNVLPKEEKNPDRIKTTEKYDLCVI